MRPAWFWVLVLATCLGACERPTATKASATNNSPREKSEPAPNVDPTQAMLDGDLAQADAVFAAQGNWLGQAEIASVRGDQKKLAEILTESALSLPQDQLTPEQLSAAGGLAASLNPIPANLVPLAQRACDAGKETPQGSAVCARLALGADRELRKCVSGCDGEQVIGFHLANFPVVHATVGGVPGVFMIHSAGPSLITPAFGLKVLGDAKPHATYTIDSSGTPVPSDVVLADLEIGGLRLADVDFTVMTLPDRFIDGALSPDELFADRRVVVDMAAWEIRVQPSAPLENGVQMVRIEDGPAIWGWVEGRPPRPMMLDFGGRHLSIAKGYDQLSDPLPIAQEIPMECAGGVACTAYVVSPFEAEMEVGGTALEAPFAYIKPTLGASTPPFILAPQALVGTGLMFGRVVTLDFGVNKATIAGGETSTFEVGDEAAFMVTGSYVRGAPITWTERVHDVGTSMDIDIVMEGTDRSETWKMRVENDPTIAMRFLLSSKPEAVWERTPDGPEQRELSDFAGAMSDIYIHPRPVSGEAIAPEPLVAKQGDVLRRCLRVHHRVQLKDGLGMMMSMHCSGDPWGIAHVRVESDSGEVILEYRRIGLEEPFDPRER